MFPPELSIIRNSGPRPRPEAASRRSSLPFPFPPSLPLPSHLDDRPWGSQEPEEPQLSLNVGLSVQCEESRMVVSINKESLQVIMIIIILASPETCEIDVGPMLALFGRICSHPLSIEPVCQSLVYLEIKYQMRLVLHPKHIRKIPHVWTNQMAGCMFIVVDTNRCGFVCI